MKRIFIILTVSLMTTMNLSSQDLQDIKLNNPNKSRGAAFMKALSDRASVRE